MYTREVTCIRAGQPSQIPREPRPLAPSCLHRLLRAALTYWSTFSEHLTAALATGLHSGHCPHHAAGPLRAALAVFWALSCPGHSDVFHAQDLKHWKDEMGRRLSDHVIYFSCYFHLSIQIKAWETWQHSTRVSSLCQGQGGLRMRQKRGSDLKSKEDLVTWKFPPSTAQREGSAGWKFHNGIPEAPPPSPLGAADDWIRREARFARPRDMCRTGSQHSRG